jgi:ABC-2 type transport system permease protein
MTAFTLAAAETRLILRNRTVLVTAAVFPLVLALLLINSGVGALTETPGALAALQLGMLLMFGLFMPITMTLAARRQQLYLKRLRTSPASTASIVTGLASPLALITLVQSGIVLAATAWESGTAPAHPELLVLAFLNGAATSVALGFLTASFTKTPEAAQITVLPGMIVLMFGMFQPIVSDGPVALWRLLIPGAALGELTETGWNGTEDGYLASIAAPLLVSTAVALAAALVAAKLFRWQPRD